ncbi:MAG: glutamine amidotransferase [Dehalococcoidia bacterium]|nr:glutamine amidotransferase [Dehalococcoidia bacterium]
MTATRTLRVLHLYGSLLNLYGDRGNILALKYRCERRGIGFELSEAGIGQSFDPTSCDLVFAGGGPDREQRRVADDLVSVKAPALREAAAAGTVILAVCGSYQLLGHYYRDEAGGEIRGVGIFDLHTEHPGEGSQRLIGNAIVDWEGHEVVGFENHGGRTTLGPSATPLARVVAGYGNNGSDGWEGARVGNVFGTYIHGSLLPKNPWLTDHLIGLALARRFGEGDLPPLDDSPEQRAHEVAAGIARAEAGRRKGTGGLRA